jgi:hypothetical protein
MKRLFFVLLLSASAQVSTAQTEAEMKAWQTFMTPGDMHKNLAASSGNWKADITMWMAPGSQPTKSVASAKNEMIMGGRYLQTTYKGEFMGMPFEGSSTTAFDNGKKVFLSTWIDNMGSGIMILEGKWNEAKKAIEMKGKQTDPMTGKDMKVRENFTFNADGTQLMEMWMEHAGKEFKAMEIRFTKA